MTQTAATTDASRSTDGALIASNRIEGTKVLDQSGKDIGTIKRLKIDRVSGRVAYAVAEFGGFFGAGGHEYTIPWQTLTYDPNKHGFSTNLSKEQLEGAPATGRRMRGEYHASMGGVGTGKRRESEATRANVVDTDDYDNELDDSWDRNSDRELYDYYTVRYYWE